MKCGKCKNKNITKANYCKKCGYKFSEEEQKEAKGKTFVGKLEKLELAYNVCTLKVITEHKLYKIGSFLIVLGIGIYYLLAYGLNVRFLNSKNYEISYNEKLMEYYIITNKNKVSLDLYIPNRTKKLIVKHFDVEGKIIEKESYKPMQEIVLETKEKEYYVLESSYLGHKKDTFKLYVLNKQ